VVQLLLDRGADPNLKGNFSVGSEYASSAHSIHTGGKHGTAIQIAVSHDDVTLVKLLLEKGARAHDQSNVSHGVKTPLITAVSKENVEIVRLLLDHDVNVDSYGNVAP
jgi:ankyrin repeat protein